MPSEYTMGVMNRFKGLDLVNRVSEELWTEVCNIVQEVANKTIPKKKKCKKAKWLSEQAPQKAEEKRSENQGGKGTSDMGTTNWFKTGETVCQGGCHRAHLTYMPSTSCKMLDWMKLTLIAGIPL